MNMIPNILYLVIFVIGPILIGLIIINNMNNCNILIDATYAGYSTCAYKNTTLYYPIFEYTYKDKEYWNQASLSIPLDNLQRYIKGNTYQIYINANNPNEYVLEKGNPIGAYICITIGIAFLFVFVLIKIGAFS